MIENLTKIYEGANLSGTITKVIYLPVLKNCTLVGLDVLTDEIVSGDVSFSLSVNGTELGGEDLALGEADEITIPNGAKIVSLSGLTITLEKGDELTLNLLSGAVSSPLTLNLRVDDGEYSGETAASLGTLIATATAKPTPVDADIFGYADSAAGNLLKKFTWLNLKAALKAVFDAIYVTGALTATDSAIALFDGTSGELIKDSGKTLSTDGTFAANSDAKIPTEKAVRTYVDTNAAPETALSVGNLISGATAKITPVNADSFIISDSAASNAGKKVTLTNFKAFLKTYFDTQYAVFPSQTGNAGKVLQTDGTNASWQKTPIEFGGACSDETTALTTGTAKLVFRSPGAVTLTNIRASLTTVSSSGTVDLNIKKNGSTIFTTKLTIDATEKSSTTAAANYVLVSTPTTFADDDEIQVDIDAAGTGAKGLKIFFFGVR